MIIFNAISRLQPGLGFAFGGISIAGVNDCEACFLFETEIPLFITCMQMHLIHHVHIKHIAHKSPIE